MHSASAFEVSDTSFVVVWSLSHVRLFPTPMDCNMPDFPVLHYLPRVCSSSCPLSQWCRLSHPLSPPSHPALNLSQHQGLFHELSLCIRCPKYWCFDFSISPSNEYSWLISFRIDYFDLFAVQGTLRPFSSPTIWKNKFLGTHLSLWSNSHIHTWLLEKP